jgi:hypothetical protein
MKKIVLPILIGISLLTACQQNEKKATEKKVREIPQVSVAKNDVTTFPYPNLLAENEQTYSLLVIGEQDNKTPIEKSTKIIKAVKNILSLPTLDMAKKIYPELQIESTPAYLLFDKNGKVHQSKNQKELTSYLESNPAK